MRICFACTENRVGDFFVISQKKFRRICEKYLGIVHRENVDNQ